MSVAKAIEKHATLARGKGHRSHEVRVNMLCTAIGTTYMVSSFRRDCVCIRWVSKDADGVLVSDLVQLNVSSIAQHTLGSKNILMPLSKPPTTTLMGVSTSNKFRVLTIPT